MVLIFFNFFFINLKNKLYKESSQVYIKENLKDIQCFININFNKILINPINFTKILHPMISHIISVYNGEGFIETAVRSVQNQDFKEIEIIIIDDFSKDNSSIIIKKLMEEDSRIIFLKNNKNRGALYTKTKGVLRAKGKYIMILDVDDLYTSKNAFSYLYEEAEKNKFDILGFSSIVSDRNIKENKFSLYHYFETPILFQPNISQRMYIRINEGNFSQIGGVIWPYFFKTQLFKKTIKEIGSKYINKYMNVHDDFLLFFLLTRNAKKFKQLKTIFHIYLRTISKDPKINFNKKEKKKKEKLNCFAYLTYIEFLLIKTKEEFYDKEIASYELSKSFLNNYCAYNNLVREKAISICKLFLKNKYIKNKVKKIIISYLKKIN